MSGEPSFLDDPDPIQSVFESIDRYYAGDSVPARLTYLCATTRLIKKRFGAMPAHIQLVGDPAGGKTWAIKVVLKHLPQSAYVEYDACSPRAIIYDEHHIHHRAIVFSEIDSIPQGEDQENPAASAIRSLMQDGDLHYQVVERASGGHFVTREVDKIGPAVLITSGIKRLGAQNGSRVFFVEVPDSKAQVEAALMRQAEFEELGMPPIDPYLIAGQSILQAEAEAIDGYDVLIPWNRALTKSLLERGDEGNRIVRDKSRLDSLIKAVAVLRMKSHLRDAAGRIIAEYADYEIVRDLMLQAYEATVSISTKSRTIIKAALALVGPMNIPVTLRQIKESLVADGESVNDKAIKRALALGVEHGMLADCRDKARATAPWVVSRGDSDLTDPTELPTSQNVKDWQARIANPNNQTESGE